MASPEMQVIDRGESLSQRAYQSLRKAIRDGAIVHGVLYSEKDLADRLGISRTPVREALIELAREGLVTIAPQRGFQLHSLSHAEQEEVYELRLAIDSFRRREAGQVGDAGRHRASFGTRSPSSGPRRGDDDGADGRRAVPPALPEAAGSRADRRPGLDAARGDVAARDQRLSRAPHRVERSSTSTRRSSTRSRRTTRRPPRER